jgi:hypothetical protein
MVFGATAPLAFRLAANPLLKAVWRRLKSALTIRAAADLDQCDSSEAQKHDELLSKTDMLRWSFSRRTSALRGHLENVKTT